MTFLVVMNRSRPLELLAPAGNFEKLKMALHYGADAVYAGLSDFSLRAQTGSFTAGDLTQWINYTHEQGKRIYVTVNIYAHNRDLSAVREHARFLNEVRPDAVVLSDPGVFEIFSTEAPGLPVHISTQANITNVESARFWKRLGAERIVLARELSLGEIREIKDGADIELEAFVHGAVCIAYSGRCFISSYMTTRSGNQGECANSCRYTYSLVEEKRPGEYFPVYENEKGTYIMSSRDLCMIEHLDKLMDAGVTSFKLEGRMKGINYAAGVVKIYREALDAFSEGKDVSHRVEGWRRELSFFSNRGFTTGMYFGKQPDEDYNHDTEAYIRSEYELAGVIQEPPENGKARVAIRNTIRPGDRLVFLTPGLEEQEFELKTLLRPDGREVDVAKNEDIMILEMPDSVRPMDIIRVRKTVMSQ